jgi:hypothetical protein
MQEHIGNDLPDGKRLNNLRGNERKISKEEAGFAGLENVSKYEDANVCYQQPLQTGRESV